MTVQTVAEGIKQHHLNASVFENFMDIVTDSRCGHSLWIRPSNVTTYSTAHNQQHSYVVCNQQDIHLLDMWKNINHSEMIQQKKYTVSRNYCK